MDSGSKSSIEEMAAPGVRKLCSPPEEGLSDIQSDKPNLILCYNKLYDNLL